MAQFEVYSSPAGYRWRIKASDGHVVAISHSFSSRENAEDSFLSACQMAGLTEIKNTD